MQLIAKNEDAGDTRLVHVAVDPRDLEDADADDSDAEPFVEELSRCTGPCRCMIEVDGICPKGRPSVALVAGTA